MKLNEHSQRKHENRLTTLNQKNPFKTIGILFLSFVFIFFLAITGTVLYARYHTSSIVQDNTAHSQTSPTETTSTESQENVSDLLNASDALYDNTTNTYSLSQNDYSTYFKNTSLSDDGNGLKSGTIYKNGETWNIYCYSYSNSCSVSTSTGTYGNVYCYEYSNSCSYSDNNGNYSNTYCYSYSSSCTTTDSNGGYSNTYCYTYSSSCSTYNSDGSTTNTYCYTYSNSCSSYSSGGSSGYSTYNSYYDY